MFALKNKENFSKGVFYLFGACTLVLEMILFLGVFLNHAH